jgi:hypothetical protein
MTIFHAEKKRFKLRHVKNWMRFFADCHNNELDPLSEQSHLLFLCSVCFLNKRGSGQYQDGLLLSGAFLFFYFES